MDREFVESQLTKMGNCLLNPGTSTSWTWMGINIVWCPKSRKNGGILKRGKVYGVIKYFDTLHTKINSFGYIELSKEEAIKEAMKPMDLRSALQEVNDSIECYICGRIGMGVDKKKWGKFSYQPYNNPYRKWLDICDKCTAFIVSRKLENFIG